MKVSPVFLIASCCCFLVSLTRAADQYWGVGNSSFATATNWFDGPNGSTFNNPGAMPGSSDRAIFDYNFSLAPYTVVLDQNRFLSEMIVGGNELSLTMNDKILSLTSLGGAGSNQGALVMGWQTNETGKLSLFNGTLKSSGAVVVGATTGGNQTLVVDTGSALSTDYGGSILSDIRVGVNGIGALTIWNGGRATSGKNLRLGVNAGSVGTLSIDGTAGNGSRMDVLGNAIFGESGTGYGVLSNGAILTTSGRSSIGADFASGTSSLVTLQSGSLWSGNSFEVGGLASGRLSLSGGSVVSGSSFIIAGGQQSGVTGMIDLVSTSLLTATQDISVGQEGGTGTLEVRSGSDVDVGGDLRVGDTKVGNGVVLVTGTGSTVDVTDELYVGLQGTGQMTISAAGVVNSAYGSIGSVFNSDTGLPSHGTMTVTGANSLWSNTNRLYVGDFGTGTLNLESGGRVLAGTTVVGRQLGSVGTVNISGSGSLLNLSGQTLTVGSGGVGTLNIYNNGVTESLTPPKVNVRNLEIGMLFLGQGTVNVLAGNGADSELPQNLYIENTLKVGGAGEGILLVQNAYVAPTSITVGISTSGNGTITLQDDAVLTTTGTMTVGQNGEGTVNVESGSLLEVNPGNQFLLAAGLTSEGTLNVNGGSVYLRAGGNFNVTDSAIFGDRGAAEVNVTNGGLLVSQGARLGRDVEGTSIVTIEGKTANSLFSTWQVNSLPTFPQEMIVGDLGVATITIRDGGRLILSGAEPVSGRQLVLGNQSSSSGGINVTQGGVLNVFGSGVIGDGGYGSVGVTQGYAAFDDLTVGNGSFGRVIVNGRNAITSASTGDLDVPFGLVAGIGSGGEAELELNSGSIAHAGSMILGKEGGSATLDVKGTGSLWEVRFDNQGAIPTDGTLIVGESGLATVTIHSGSRLNVGGQLILGRLDSVGSVQTLGDGTLVVEDGGALTVGDAVTVGKAGVGELILREDTQIGSLIVGDEAKGQGTVIVENQAVLKTNGFTLLGYLGYANMTVQGQSQWQAGSLSIGNGDFGEATGTYGELQVLGGSTVESTELNLGYNGGSLGILSVSGNSTFETGVTLAGINGPSFVTVDSGSSFETTELRMGLYDASTSVFGLTGTSSVVRVTGATTIGEYGAGEFDVTSGGSLFLSSLVLGKNEQGTGRLTVASSQSSFVMTGALTVGKAGAGTFELLGGQLALPTSVVAGDASTATGTINLRNASHIGTTGNIVIGQFGQAEFHVESGSTFSTDNLRAGWEAGSLGDVVLDGTEVLGTVVNNTSIGYDGVGSLTLLTGARLNTGAFSVGLRAGGNGTASLGLATTVQTDTTAIGTSGNGELTMTLGAELLTDSLFTAVNAGSRGEIHAGSNSQILVGKTLTLKFGIEGYSLVTLTGGSKLEAGHVVLADVAGSESYLTLADSGTVMRAEGDLYVGKGGVGDLAVLGGSLLETGTPNSVDLGGDVIVQGAIGGVTPGTPSVAVIGEGNGSAGSRVTVQGNGSTWVHHGDIQLGLNPSAGAELRVFSLALLDVDGVLDIGSSGLFTLNDGRVEVGDFTVSGASMEAVDWVKGEFFFKDDKALDEDISLYLLQGEGIRAGRTLGAEGNFQFETDITLNGGVLDAGTLSQAARLDFQSGTLRLDSALIGLGELFDGLLVYDTAFAATHKLEFQSTTIEDRSLVQVGNGATFRPGQLTNRGEVAMNGSTARLISNAVTNEGLITGTGRILSDVQNMATGEVRADVGERLVLQGLYHNNQGAMVVEQGRLDVIGTLFNTSGAQINVVDGSLTTNGYVYNSGYLSVTNGTARFDGELQNNAVMQLAGTQVDVFGTVRNQSGGEIRVAGNTSARIYDDFVNNGVVNMSPTSIVSSLGALSGSGTFTGGGTLEILGDYMPGNSPGIMIVEGNLVLTSASRLFFELGGETRGVDYDATDVDGLFTLGGTLTVILSSGYEVVAGAVYDLFDWVESLGSFTDVVLPDLGPGKSWDMSRFASEGKIQVSAEGMTYGDWLQGFTFEEDVDISPTGDVDHDGRQNLMEYVLGTHPLQADTRHDNEARFMFVEVEGLYYPALEYVRPSSESTRRVDTIEHVKVSETLAGESWSTADMMLHSKIDDGEYETVIYRRAVPWTAGHSAFLRLEVSLVP